MVKREKEKDEETIYDEEGREDLVESDELDPQEAAFMKGYEEADEDDEDKKEEDEDDEDQN